MAVLHGHSMVKLWHLFIGSPPPSVFRVIKIPLKPDSQKGLPPAPRFSCNFSNSALTIENKSFLSQSFRSLHINFFQGCLQRVDCVQPRSFPKRFRLTRLLLLLRTEERCWQQSGVKLHFSNPSVSNIQFGRFRTLHSSFTPSS